MSTFSQVYLQIEKYMICLVCILYRVDWTPMHLIDNDKYGGTMSSNSTLSSVCELSSSASTGIANFNKDSSHNATATCTERLEIELPVCTYQDNFCFDSEENTDVPVVASPRELNKGYSHEKINSHDSDANVSPEISALNKTTTVPNGKVVSGFQRGSRSRMQVSSLKLPHPIQSCSESRKGNGKIKSHKEPQKPKPLIEKKKECLVSVMECMTDTSDQHPTCG